MNQPPDIRGDIIREFCRSHGAPTADWLGRLSRNGQRECIKQWILRVMSPEIRGQLAVVAQALYAEAERPGLAEKMYEETVRQGMHRSDFAPETLAEESRKKYCVTFAEAGRHFVNRQLDEELRYGAIQFGDVDAPKLSLKNKRYRRYRDLCDQEWQRMVEGKQTARDSIYRPALATLIFTALALAFTTVRVAMWFAVIGGLVSTLMIWPRHGRNRIAEEGFDGFVKTFRRSE